MGAEMSLPRMSLHIGDYKKDTGHLTAAEHGAYLLLIMHYWATGGLPDDDKRLALIAKMSLREWHRHKSILAAFFPDGWGKHKRIDAEIIEAEQKYKNRVEAGRKGGLAKHKSSNARAMLEQCSANPNPNPKEVSKKERARATRLPDEWKPSSEDWTTAVSKLGESNAENQLAIFRDYWRAVPGAKGVKLDWNGTWRNWCRRAGEFGKNGGNRVQTTVIAAADRLIERIADFGGGGREETEETGGTRQIGGGEGADIIRLLPKG